MILIELDKPAAEPVSAGEAKAWARIERDDEDAVVAALVSAARESVEQRTGLVLGARAFRLVLDEVPRDGRIVPGRREIARVTGVRSFEADGRETIHDPALVRVTDGALVLDPILRNATGVEIEFVAGEAPVPEAVRQAILRIVAASYETRGLVSGAMQPAIVPAFAQALLAPFRPVRL